MRMLPCKKCPECGMYHDLTVVICEECGKELHSIPAVLMDTDSIPGEFFGQIQVEKDIPVYVQKCPACGTLNFTSNKDKPVMICYNCHKKRVSTVSPVVFSAKSDSTPVVPLSERVQNGIFIDKGIIDSSQELSTADEPRNSDDDMDAETMSWINNLTGNIGMVVSSRQTTVESESETFKSNRDTDFEDSYSYEQKVDFEADSEIETAPDWSFLDTVSSSSSEVGENNNRCITLTAVRYGQLSFTVTVDRKESYMLGRSAEQSDFLANDGRVGNEHCYLFFKNGSWYVKDNNSKNGTAVNSRDIGVNGEQELHNGDELKLGHHPDSMAFRITIV